MNKIKSAVFLALAIFLGGNFMGAAAQTKVENSFIEPPPAESLAGPYNMKVEAVELSKGEVDLASGMTYGWTSYGKTDGDLSGFAFFSVNYAAPDVESEVGVEPAVRPIKILTGSWSKLIFMNGLYVGSVSGTVVSGGMVWNAKGQNWDVSFDLISERGTEAFVGSQGKGTFSGTLDESGKTPTLTGLLYLEY